MLGWIDTASGLLGVWDILCECHELHKEQWSRQGVEGSGRVWEGGEVVRCWTAGGCAGGRRAPHTNRRRAIARGCGILSDPRQMTAGSSIYSSSGAQIPKGIF
jgi:hypothetical protein